VNHPSFGLPQKTVDYLLKEFRRQAKLSTSKDDKDNLTFWLHCLGAISLLMAGRLASRKDLNKLITGKPYLIQPKPRSLEEVLVGQLKDEGRQLKLTLTQSRIKDLVMSKLTQQLHKEKALSSANNELDHVLLDNLVTKEIALLKADPLTYTDNEDKLFLMQLFLMKNLPRIHYI
jgi:hypothetical protein